MSELVNELKNFDRAATVIAVSGLAAISQNHTHILRLDALVHLAAIYANGKKTPSPADLDRWLNRLLKDSPVARLEDPAEDVAIGNIITGSGNKRIFNGDSSHSDYYLQDILDALAKAPPDLDSLKRESLALLSLSVALAERNDHARFALGEAEDEQAVAIPTNTSDLWEQSQKSIFEPSALDKLGIDAPLLRPFCLSLDGLKQRAPGEKLMHPRSFPLLITIGDSVHICDSTPPRCSMPPPPRHSPRNRDHK